MTKTYPFPVTVLLGDPRLPDRSKPGGRFTDDDFDQVVRLKRALAELTDYDFTYWNDHGELLERLRRSRPEFVLNCCDTGFRNRADHELHVAAYLEMLEIPYSGSGPVALGMCFDKGIVRAIAQSCGVPVPRETYLRRGEDPQVALADIAYPAFVKPSRADGSLGITQRSLVNNQTEAIEAIRLSSAAAPDSDTLVQEYLDGAEFGVGVVGNPGHGLTLLPVLEIDYGSLPPGLPHILDYSSKVDPDSPYWTDIGFARAGLKPDQIKTLTDTCARLFARLGLRDYARFDFRTDGAGVPKLLEANPNPAWCWDGKLAHMLELDGRPHSDLLAMIITAARIRLDHA